MKKLVYILCAAALAGWFVFRFVAIASENSRHVYNTARIAADQGTPVQILEVVRKTDALKEPLSVKNNRALVSGGRLDKFAPGQKVGDGYIVSVARHVDLDSGMHVVRTSGVKDGLNYAKAENTGYFVPIQAISNDTVMVVVDGMAHKRDIKIANKDSETAVVSQGLSDGDK
ncbi:MAG: hypothetical protein LBF28_01605, partial [Rickettsiales bacterium]|nr:hypothetical protein [Rickettsiales bacterium]